MEAQGDDLPELRPVAAFEDQLEEGEEEDAEEDRPELLECVAGGEHGQHGEAKGLGEGEKLAGGELHG